MSSGGHSNVGFPSLYESQNQKHYKQSEVEELQKHTGENLKGFLPKDQEAEVNRLRSQDVQRRQAENLKNDPTFAATLHGNKPHKGAIIDKEIQQEEAEQLRKKGDAMTGKSM
ncbi:hypothetical protein N657DRAFT_659562 [Parathielavia appendiculata]|uniref:Uncharacterized protein n=1 Tax=Parathielavia appendiculata TaxID=2587402 RepID=A0AAN6YYQ3_9PEZI|nr:hypothetical protein N657DRAFT_659562 [Parathielavia appendiculata]